MEIKQKTYSYIVHSAVAGASGDGVHWHVSCEPLRCMRTICHNSHNNTSSPFLCSLFNFHTSGMFLLSVTYE